MIHAKVTSTQSSRFNIQSKAAVILAWSYLLLFLPVVRGEEPFRYPEAKHGKGELRYYGNIPVLTVAGTPREIGEQIGELAGRPLGSKFALIKEFTRSYGLGWALISKACKGLYARFPDDSKAEIEAMAKAAGVDLEILIVANCIGDIQHLGGCSAIVVEPSRSKTGQTIVGRNWDNNPVAGLPYYSLVIVRRPDGKRAFVSVAFPGILLCGSEMNDAGLVLASNDARDAKDGSPRLNPLGTSFAVGGRHLMEKCGNLAEAEQFIAGIKPTTTGLLVLCDGKESKVFEATPKQILNRSGVDGLCFCTNHFRLPQLSKSTECDRFAKLEKLRDQPKLGIEDVAKALHAVNQGAWTLQSMIFEPSALRVHLALGVGPVTGKPLTTIELGPLFGVGQPTQDK